MAVRGSIRHWPLWKLSRRAQAYVLGVDAAALSVLGVAFALQRSRQFWTGLGPLIAFTLAAAVSIEVFRRVGNLHRGTNRSFHNLLSVFFLGGAIVLPPAYALVLPLPVLVLRYLRAFKLPPLKAIFNASMYVLVSATAWGVHRALAPSHLSVTTMAHRVPGVVSLVAAALAFVVVNHALLIGCLRRVAPATPWRATLGDRESWMLSLADVSAGIVLALAWESSLVLFVVAMAPMMLLQRSVVYRHMIEVAQTDSKTGLANPSHWRAEAGRVVSRTRQGEDSAAVLMVDLDHFKAINDDYGHLVGDTVLAAVADTLRLAVRPRDLVGRFGGEEFTILLVETGLADAVAVADRICGNVRAMRIPLDRSGRTPPQVTASVGVAVLGDHGADLEELLISADSALYRAKTAGRDCACVAERDLYVGQPLTASGGRPVEAPSRVAGTAD